MSTSFRYRALRADGSVQRGTMVAAHRDAVAEMLAARGVLAVEVRPAGALARGLSVGGDGMSGLGHGLGLGGRGLPEQDLAIGLHSLATLLEAGLPVSRTLDAFEGLAPTGWRAVLPHVRQAVREGHGIADAFAAAPRAFPPLVLGLLRAGEAGSGLAAAVRRAAEFTEQQAEMRAAVRGALVYPAIVAATGVGAVALMVGVVLPRFATLLGDLGQALPPTTRLVLAVGDLARTSVTPGLLSMVAAWAMWRLWLSRPSSSARWHGILLALPLVGSVRLGAATSRVCGALAALLDAGVPLPTALRQAEPAAADAAIGARLLAARNEVIRGSRIAEAIGAHDALSPTAVRLLQVGEASGRLAPLLAHAARLEADRVQRTVRDVVRLLEPALILLLGGVIALVAAALLQAVYGVRPGA